MQIAHEYQDWVTVRSNGCQVVVGEACESAAASQVVRRFQLPETTVRAIDLRCLERWDQRRRTRVLVRREG